MKKLLLLIVAVIFISTHAMAQTAPQEADPKDVGSLDAIMKAVYDVISGDAGKIRDWDRFRSLFHKDARLIPSGKNAQTGVIGARVLEKNGFHEREISRHVDQYGNIAQVFSTYASFHKSDDKDPFMRGINSFQLFNDGKRWWIITIYWQHESPENLIPKEFLKSGK